MVDQPASGEQGGLLARHVLIQVVLGLAFFLPGGFVWNSVTPFILGMPFSVFVELLLLPLLILLNAIWFVRSYWRRDLALMEQLRTGRSLREPDTAPSE